MDVDRIEQLKALRKSRLLEAAIGGLPKELQRARLDCLIYFHTRIFPWKRRDPDGDRRNGREVEAGGVYDERRLGYPKRFAVWNAIARVHKTCPTESKEYELSLRRFREARRRFNATKTVKSWRWYVRGDGNTDSVAYRTFMNCLPGVPHCFNDDEAGFVGRFKYRVDELLSRTEERKRARREIKDALAQMECWRSKIFDKMKVPADFRSLA